MKKFFLPILALAAFSCRNTPPATVKDVMDGFVTRLYKDFTPAQLDTLSHPLALLSGDEKEVLATKYLTFETNVPVVVSLMRDQAQKTVPFWLAESGFRKTALTVRNEEYTYEVWQKAFPAGKIGLGINGFDKHRPVYFVSVAPERKEDKLTVSHVWPESQTLSVLRKGAFTYHDWDDLVLTEVPAALDGQVLFQTIRGRAREAHVVGAFRTTPMPSSVIPDQLLLTWSGDPKTTMDVQWRTAPGIAKSQVQYWMGKDTLTAPATAFRMEDRLLRNDRYVNRFTASLKGLVPGTTYGYRVGDEATGWSPVSSFQTEKAEPAPFSYIWFGDTHKSPQWGEMARKSLERHPDISFYNIAGDLVSTGLHRDEWDEFFRNSGTIFRSKPLMPIPGNHDSQDGLGAWMYEEMFSLPKNGPARQPAERTYAYTYQNALYLMIDATLPLENQTAWIREQLKNTKATWKFVYFHFPPYNYEEDYSHIRKEWCTVFDEYGVDMVMGGHVHYYMRTKPMKAEKPDPKGTIYLISVGIPADHPHMTAEDYAVVRDPKGWVYQHVEIDGNKLHYRCFDKDGNLKDELNLTK